MKKRKYHNKYKSIDEKENVQPSVVGIALLMMVAMGIGALAYHFFLTQTSQI